ncbi:MAG: outer membrane beta-barrel domain-containing protein [Desulfobacteraceae bacterium]|nr:outer membrane beta-barrel domain-containing protein [Desulfobacteraceae bacterium]
MRHFTWLLAVVLAVILGITSGAAAGHRADSFMISPFIGGYAFDSDLNLEDELTYGIGVGYNFTENLAAEAVFNYTDTELDNGAFDVEGYLYRMDALYHFMPENRLVPYVAAGLGAFDFDPEMGDSETEFSGNIGAGVKYFLNESIALRADVRDVMTFPENNLLYTAGLTFYLGGREKAPEAAAAEPAEKRHDSDGDGVYDSNDQCPDTPSGVAVDNRGCAVDSDGDGVSDYRDDCMNTPKGAEVDASGCALDSDNDGVIDYHDECPGTPEGAEVDDKGCVVDTDNDGVANYKDECLNTPQGASVNARGCWVVEDLQFEVGKAEIRPAYHNNLNEVVSVLMQNPEIDVEIQGHTDSQGATQMNQQLSEHRAKAVRDYLVEQGVDANRLDYKGYGETDPVASNDTAQGRAKNRRVEIRPLY